MGILNFLGAENITKRRPKSTIPPSEAPQEIPEAQPETKGAPQPPTAEEIQLMRKAEEKQLRKAIKYMDYLDTTPKQVEAEIDRYVDMRIENARKEGRIIDRETMIGQDVDLLSYELTGMSFWGVQNKGKEELLVDKLSKYVEKQMAKPYFGKLDPATVEILDDLLRSPTEELYNKIVDNFCAPEKGGFKITTKHFMRHDYRSSDDSAVLDAIVARIDINEVNDKGENVGHRLLGRETPDIDKFKYALNHGLEKDAVTKDGSTYAHVLAKSKSHDMARSVDSFVKHGCPIDSKDGAGKTPTDILFDNRNFKSGLLFMKAGAEAKREHFEKVLEAFREDPAFLWELLNVTEHFEKQGLLKQGMADAIMTVANECAGTDNCHKMFLPRDKDNNHDFGGGEHPLKRLVDIVERQGTLDRGDLKRLADSAFDFVQGMSDRSGYRASDMLKLARHFNDKAFAVPEAQHPSLKKPMTVERLTEG